MTNITPSEERTANNATTTTTATTTTATFPIQLQHLPHFTVTGISDDGKYYIISPDRVELNIHKIAARIAQQITECERASNIRLGNWGNRRAYSYKNYHQTAHTASNNALVEIETVEAVLEELISIYERIGFKSPLYAVDDGGYLPGGMRVKLGKVVVEIAEKLHIDRKVVGQILKELAEIMNRSDYISPFEIIDEYYLVACDDFRQRPELYRTW